MSTKNLKFEVMKKSAGEYILKVKDKAFSKDFFELRKMVKFKMPIKANPEELEKFKLEWENVRDYFLIKPDDELFDIVEANVKSYSSLGFETVFGVTSTYNCASDKERKTSIFDITFLVVARYSHLCPISVTVVSMSLVYCCSR